ncbi:hypothetical protein D5H75_04155 [Bailinhaonella thermotolerans]|uniref:Uncharacterized protein n=1 Tax=Bailinhaonella thermotolerans TaxID=1070861 RepID=A0A3A4B525_9ACTN|nr:hypothetical protein D5H75_04155 [Bailinhaonella thermotolerans]
MAALLAPVIGLALLVMIPIWVDDARLDALAERAAAHPLPPRTHRADADVQRSVTLRGNGNHCDYLVRLALSSTLPAAEIARYYENARIEGVDDDRADTAVYFHESPTPAKRPPTAPRSFILEVSDSTDAGLDLRCH